MIPADILRRFDAYLDGSLPEEEIPLLEAALRDDSALRAAFVRYAALAPDLAIEMRARAAGSRLLDDLPVPRRRALLVPLLALAAGILLALSIVWLWPRADAPEEIAWLVNAQNAEWGEGHEPGSLRAGSTLQLAQGLVALRFRSGARLVLEGPAEITLHSDMRVSLAHGKVGARIPESAHGFTVLSPHGEVIDLGTEFGIGVSPEGKTDVRVYEGEVIARDRGKQQNLLRDQAARIDDAGVRLDRTPLTEAFVRTIEAPPAILPRTRRLDFRRAQEQSLLDANGQGIGLTHRLPGTGTLYEKLSPNLRLVPESSHLELTTTNSDINRQVNMPGGEYLGVRLADLGFTGSEDFEVSVRMPNIPALNRVGQFGVYAGTRSDANIRGGLISRQDHGEYTIFHVNNRKGVDQDSHFLGLFTTGDEIRIRLKRISGKYALTVENLTTGAGSTLVIAHPTWLDDSPDLYVGLFGANTRSELRRTLTIQEFSATVWTKRVRGGKM